jgi:aryl-alcohol dehydrogenase-like predicted oxidoreductase
VPPDHERHLALPAIGSRARAAATAADDGTTGLRAVRLPFSAVMADAFTVAAHERAEGVRSALGFAWAAGIDVFAGAPPAQGALLDGLPSDAGEQIDGETPAQRALDFARSAPAVTAALVDTASRERLQENMAAGAYDPLGARAIDRVFD